MAQSVEQDKKQNSELTLANTKSQWFLWTKNKVLSTSKGNKNE